LRKLSIFGLGYVGVVSSACFADRGNDVIGVDVSDLKVNIINDGRSPIVEEGIEQLIAKNVETGRLRCTTNYKSAILDSDISFICVGTPSNENGSLSLDFIEKVSHQIGSVLKDKSSYHIIVVRSTVLPGTIESKVIPIIEGVSGKKAGVGFGIIMNPEFLRESSAVYDFNNPPKTVIGSLNASDADAVGDLYENLPGGIIKTELKTAETVKYTDNVFHALKVVFANEIGAICQAHGINSHKVMEIFCQDTKLNLSPYYLKPGFAFGGSCLPKDVRALTSEAKRLNINVPILNSIIDSNQKHINSTARRILDFSKKRVGVLGFAFKSGTDDLRESPIVELIESLLGKGCDIRIFDECVSMAAIFGANKEFIEKRMPHILNLMVYSISEVLNHSEIIIIGNNAPEFKDIFSNLKSDQIVFDLVGIIDAPKTKAQYHGISW
jgi:GDP-mannose 6-dehydrogenase